MKTERILIVGGGSAGWMSAAFLKKTFPEKEIVVIESPSVPIVGVGESTLGDITNFRDYLGINEQDFMQFTDASYKMSIKFTDFYDVDAGSFHYPFRRPDESDVTVNDWLTVKAHYPDTPNEEFVRNFSPQSALFEANKFQKNKYGLLGNYNPQSDVAYHFDAVKFSTWLRDHYCIPRGVQHIRDTIVDVQQNEFGIEHLLLESKTIISADLYVDCTGFSSLLLSQYLKEPFDSYSHLLPNNRAWAVQVPYIDKEKEIEPFTNCTAIGHGWCWNIPLWSRLGTGYVYSDQFISPEDATEEYKQYLMSDKMVIPRTREQVDSLVFKDIKMRVGIHNRTFVKNVVAIGLSAGFIEPLESNGLFSVQWFLVHLGKSLLRDKVSQWDRDVYNRAVRVTFNNFTEFVALHYALSHREDTPYWQEISRKSFDPAMSQLEYPKAVGFADLAEAKMFRGTTMPGGGITYVSIGMNYPVYDRVTSVYYSHNNPDVANIDRLVSLFQDRRERWADAAKNAPSLYEYLRDNVHNASS